MEHNLQKENYIILEGVQKTLKRRRVLKDINLQLEQGKVYGFFGRNASGKSMLFRAISGLIVPDAGKVTVFGTCISEKRLFPEDMGLVIENVTFWKSLTGMENLRLVASIRQKATEDDLKEALERVGLDPADKRKYRAYSLGMRQKLALAQAIMEHPKLLILDEPTNGLDEDTIALFQKMIAEEKAKGTTCLIATHQKEDIIALCDECYHIKEGVCTKVEKEEEVPSA